MLSLYKHGSYTYVVLCGTRTGTEVEVSFICRTEKGKGALPKKRMVPEKDLVPMTSTKEFNRLVEELNDLESPK